ncbi:hypothetical protein [Sandarakinorhabdus sp. DWP1-3-1]|uniref:hypothetical protein n=1 Tax=Sandarakinorhabdus sp. DWP1-3-1 TaxID=2804627 RepID=UPI003CF3B0E0
MKAIIALALSALSLSPVAAAPADPLLVQIVAGARAVPPASIAFERSVRTLAQEGAAAPETQLRTERWDGKVLTPLTVGGKPASAEDVARIRKAAAARPIAGYYRIADYLGGKARRVADAQGRTVYRVEGLPKGSIDIGKDISANLVAEALVDTSGPVPFVSRLRIMLAKPLSFFLVAKLDTFEVVNEYKPGPGGRPALVRQTQSLAGAQLGKAGTTRTETIYTPTR